MLLILLACAPDPTAIQGAVSGLHISQPATAFWGGRYLFFADVALDCMDVYWVHSAYSQGEAPTDQDLVGLQFTFVDDPELFAGTFSVEGEAAVNARVLQVRGAAFSQYRARSGTLVIDAVEDQGWATGSFDLAFDDGSLQGTWSADFCINLPE